jgi:hypothetical protein
MVGIAGNLAACMCMLSELYLLRALQRQSCCCACMLACVQSSTSAFDRACLRRARAPIKRSEALVRQNAPQGLVEPRS